MEKHECLICKEGIGEDGKQQGIEIKNFALDNIPSEISVCKTCSESIAIGIMSGRVNPLKLFSLLKGK